ncbi:hypothetical protein DYB32_007088 [Aphanomyces invadans]|uniref:Uncharacterized protein n=1 Tax=Aphanomyces invadans TaxID=157072 RepID=A0A3R7A5Z7_9STRA|nr:hypothetical protein DYB32_007088 [Aphanomyces invadans]
MPVASAGWITFGALVLFGIASGLPFWSHAPPSANVSISVGLWQFCVYVHSKATTTSECPIPFVDVECWWLHATNNSPFSTVRLCSMRSHDTLAMLTCDAPAASTFLRRACSGTGLAAVFLAVAVLALVAASFVVGFVYRDRDYAGPAVPVPTMWPTMLLSLACSFSVAWIVVWSMYSPPTATFGSGAVLQVAATGVLMAALGVEIEEIMALGGLGLCRKALRRIRAKV